MTNEIQLKPVVTALQIKAKIEDALRRAAQIDAAGISVQAIGGDLTLRGQVHSWSERHDAEQVAFHAPGVSSVANLIEIRY